MADQDEYGIKNPQDKVKVKDNIRLHKTKDLKQYYRKEDEYNPEISAVRTPGGHYFGHDNTQGNERIWYKHASGSGFEILMDGSAVHTTIGNHYQYHKGGVYKTVEGSMDTKVGGHERHNVTGGRHEEVRGNKTSFVAGGHAQIVGGMYNLQATGGVSFTSEGTVTLGGSGKGNKTAPVRITIGKDGTCYITANKNIIMNAGQDILISAGGKIGVSAGDKWSAEVAGIQFKSSAEVKIGSDKEIHLGAQKVYGSKSVFYAPNLASSKASDPSPDMPSGEGEAAAAAQNGTPNTNEKGSIGAES